MQIEGYKKKKGSPLFVEKITDIHLIMQIIGASRRARYGKSQTFLIINNR